MANPAHEWESVRKDEFMYKVALLHECPSIGRCYTQPSLADKGYFLNQLYIKVSPKRYQTLYQILEDFKNAECEEGYREQEAKKPKKTYKKKGKKTSGKQEIEQKPLQYPYPILHQMVMRAERICRRHPALLYGLQLFIPPHVQSRRGYFVDKSFPYLYGVMANQNAASKRHDDDVIKVVVADQEQHSLCQAASGAYLLKEDRQERLAAIRALGKKKLIG